MPAPFRCAVAFGLLSAQLGASGDVALDRLDPPARAGARAADLTTGGEDLLLTWLEPMPASPKRYRLRFSRRHRERWSPAVTVDDTSDFFVNWADTPRVFAVTPRERLRLFWLARNGSAPYAYAVLHAESHDGGESWRRMGRLHDDDSPTEHGFVSFVPESERVFWLDARPSQTGGTALRSKRLGSTQETVVDPRVCDCCPTDATLTHDGPVVVYRDRSAEEIRDMSVVRVTESGFSAPRPVAGDGWKIHGCPVNGPAIDAKDNHAVVAWFTAAGDRPRVQVAFSSDAAEHFSEPIPVEGRKALGRVDVELLGPGDAVLSWLASTPEGAEIRLQRIRADGRPQPAHAVVSTRGDRRSGTPRLARLGHALFLAWLEVGGEDGSFLRCARIGLDEL